MLILSFDTTAAQCAVALCRDAEVLSRRREIMEQGHAEGLVPMIQACVAAAGYDFDDLERIAVSVGPGSFTGVRVGLATARGLALAGDIPVIGVTSTEALAAGAKAKAAGAPILAAIDTKRGDFYVQLFSAEVEPLAAVSVIGADALKGLIGGQRVVVVGSGAVAAAAALGEKAAAALDEMPDPAVIARLAIGRVPAPGGPLPLYVSPPSVTLPAGARPS